MAAPATAPRPKDLGDALAAVFVDVSADEQRLVVTVYQTLLRGRAATIGQLATASGWSRQDVGERLHSWPGVFFDGDGRVVGFWGWRPRRCLTASRSATRSRGRGARSTLCSSCRSSVAPRGSARRAR